jgi:hypothetical protein
LRKQGETLQSSGPCPARSPPHKGSGEVAQSGLAAPLSPLGHSFHWRWHGHMLRRCIMCLHAKDSQKHCLSSSIKWGAPPLFKHTLILSIASHTSLFSCSFYFPSCLEQGKATLENLAPWKKWLLVWIELQVLPKLCSHIIFIVILMN